MSDSANKQNIIPITIEIELTNHCNLNCVMCPRESQKATLGYMDQTLINSILDETLQYSPVSYCLHGLGEPLLHPALLDTVTRIKNGDNSIYLTTNGHLLSKEMSSELIKMKTDRLNISIGAATRQTYKKIRRSEKFDIVIANTLELIKLRDQMNSKMLISVQIIDTHEASAEVDEFVAFWKNYKVQIEVWCDFQKGFDAYSKKHAEMMSIPCKELWNHVLINWQGKMVLCCQDSDRSHILGDVTLDSLVNVFNSPKAQKYRKLHKTGKRCLMNICKNCIYFDSNIYRKSILLPPNP